MEIIVKKAANRLDYKTYMGHNSAYNITLTIRHYRGGTSILLQVWINDQPPTTIIMNYEKGAANVWLTNQIEECVT